MTEQQVKEFQNALRKTYSNMSFAEFCTKTEFVGEYAQEKWRDFQQGTDRICSFDANTLFKILS